MAANPPAPGEPILEVRNFRRQVRQYIITFPEEGQNFTLDEAVSRTGTFEQAFDHLIASGLAFRVLIKVVVVIGDPEGDQAEWYDYVLHTPPFEIEPGEVESFERWDQVEDALLAQLREILHQLGLRGSRDSIVRVKQIKIKENTRKARVNQGAVPRDDSIVAE